MRFAYIDSQGNEVPIPSIDALALRIELGAVGPDTQLYDAQADHWGPAHTHEIFHTLSRDAEDEGFVAPPPVAPAPPVASMPPPGEPEEEPEPEAEEEEEEEAAGEFDLGLTLADPVPGPAEEEPAETDSDVGDVALDLAEPSDELSLADAGPLVPEEPVEDSAAESEGGGFDFGDLGSGLELEESSAEEEDMGLESPMEFAAPAADFGGGDDELQLEQPMSEFQPDAPPGWMEESAAEEVMDFSTAAAEEEETTSADAIADAPARQRRTPKTLPSKPKFKKQRSTSLPIVLVVLVIALGVGGYYGWPFVQQWLDEQGGPERPQVVLPDIPEELLPQMQSIGEAAIADVVADVSEATRVADAPSEPDDAWLSGMYLGNASQYPGIEAFWASIDDFLGGLRASEWQMYHDKYVERVSQAGLDATAAAQITERADSGFVAAEQQRRAVYGVLQRLVEASLGLHDFLLQNESVVEYRPGVTNATDPSVDPVLEIRAPAQARDRMLELFDEITGSLGELGSRDGVTRDGLVGAMTARLQQVGLD